MAKSVSLVLGSGGARGNAHVGVIEELLRRDYEIVSIAGCSMGALIGGVYAAGKLDAYKEWATARKYFDVLRLVDLSFENFGMIRGDKVASNFRKIVGDHLIEDLPIAYTAVATDLTYQKEVWFQKGDLLQAVRASIAIPGLFTPVIKNGHVLVDGGLLNPIPITPTLAQHADLIVAVNLNALPVSRGDEPDEYISPDAEGVMEELEFEADIKQPMIDLSFGRKKKNRGKKIGQLEMIYQSVEVMQSTLTQYKIAGYPPDILIEVPKGSCRFHEFHRAQEMIDIGREAARHVLDHYESTRRFRDYRRGI